MGGPIFLLLMLAAGWLLLVRPQQQRLRAQRELISSLTVGDRIVTAGGLIGTIARLTDRDAEIEVAPGIILRFLRPAISRRLDAEDGEDAEDAEDTDVIGGTEAFGATDGGNGIDGQEPARSRAVEDDTEEEAQ
jgi:preprotein translocase subunit YajC